METLLLAATVLDDQPLPEATLLKRLLLPESLEHRALRMGTATVVTPPPRLRVSKGIVRARYVGTEAELLRAAYAANRFPNVKERLQIAKVTGRTPRQVQVFFQNARQRDAKKKRSPDAITHNC